MVSPESRPKLRWPLDIQHLTHDGRRFAVVRDLLEIAPQPIVLPAELLPVLGRFDGERTVASIVQEGERFGITYEVVAAIAQELEQGLMLDGEHSRAQIREAKTRYRAERLREASHVGAVYPSEPKELSRVIEGYLAKSPSGAKLSGSSESAVAFIAPHIDYQRGWKTYGVGYSALQSLRHTSDVIVLLGTSHQPGSGTFHLTDKSFVTPFGVFPVAEDVVTDIASKYGVERSFQDEILHRKEHSLELQMPFLAYHYRNRKAPGLVPVLVGSFHECLVAGRRPEEFGEIGDFIEILGEVTKQLIVSGRRVLFYGGIDLAHVGNHFGDNERMSHPARLAEVEKRDQILLNHVLASDERALFEHMAEDLDRRRICGFPSLYTMFAALRRAGIMPKGQLLEYRQAVDAESDCVVTFASAIWFAQ